MQNDSDVSALHIAAKNGNLTNVKSLVMSGADVNGADTHGWCPLMLAVWNDREEVADFLLQHGARINCSLPSGWTPLCAAAENGKSYF